MEELQKLESLSLVSKVCTELENHLGMNDKTLAEFVIMLAGKSKTVEKFQKLLDKNGAEFPDSLTTNIYRLIKTMASATTEVKVKKKKKHIISDDAKEKRRKKYPGLSIPDEPQMKIEEVYTTTFCKLAQLADEDEKVAASALSELEALLPKAIMSKEEESEFGDVKSEISSLRKEGRRRSRSSSEERYRKRDRHNDRDRNRDRDRDRNSRRRDNRDKDSRRGRHRSRSRSHSPNRYERNHRKRDTVDRPPEAAEIGKIYDGKVTNIMNFGCFVQLFGIRERQEGLVHISQLRREGRVNDVNDVVAKGQNVKVKVLSMVGKKISLSMKAVDQSTGEDLNPGEGVRLPRSDNDVMGELRNPDRPSTATAIPTYEEGMEDNTKKKFKRISSPEKWEIKQLISAGVLDKADYPDFDEETGILPKEDDSDDEVEIELREEEPPFLQGQTKLTINVSPVKIVKNPDGTLPRAAMMQSALSKERREIKQQLREAQADTIPKDINKMWIDPVPEVMEGDQKPYFAQDMKGAAMQSQDMPEWKKATFGGKGGSYGKKTNLSILEQRHGLPIFKLRNELVKAVHDNQVLIVIGETGSGKTTQITQYLAEEGFTTVGKIGCTQPRRVAAMSVAKRVSEEFGCRLGQEVGYTIRFEDCTTPETKIKYMTDGMLLRECLIDPSMSQYSLIMLDEAHERTIHTDVLFGLMKKAVKQREDLKLIVTSATLDAVKFSTYFFEAPIFTIPGRTFPVEILYTKEAEADYLDAALITVMQIHLTEPPGDILVFLTGQEEIDTSCEILYERMKSLGPDVPDLIILPVYSALPSDMQTRIFDPAPPGSRKVVIATNIAETSLTIDGIFYVVDPGFVKQNVYNSKTGIDQLVVTPISQAQAKQRSGRAGRTGPGKCYRYDQYLFFMMSCVARTKNELVTNNYIYRLYTERAYRDEMLSTNVPEIQRTNLAATILTLKAMGINDLISFDFMDPPPMETMTTALESLHSLSALDDEGLLTRLGRRMAEFPLPPPLSKMLIQSVHLACSDEVLTVVSMLSVQNVFYRPKEKQALADQKKAKFHQVEGDHITLLAVYNAWKNSKFSNAWCFENFIQARSLKRSQDIRKQLLGIMDRHKLDVVSCGKNTIRAQKAIVSGYFRNAAKKDPQEGYKTQVDNQAVYIHPSSSLFNRQPEWVVYHELVLTTKEYMREVTALDPKWLVEFAPAFYKYADKNKLSKRKREQRIEPLFNRYEEPNSWRISRAYRRR
ncbi:ATP-dependent RNA helicase DHX8-like isoform X3 [Hydractinia symbiolongicarpus]|uniref:ATP-dependent RNA helicase DHX8-like isoform X3 n=1 Tax=Hydractinia symbiolongicarpus TaxID=13093 RepID=UPI00254ACEAA|nr:ATP-dependent RNA helicase DHX8-like isoform X3 [Hydractinia symbiolongicarpus]